MTKSEKPLFSWKVHLLGGSLLGSSLVVFTTLLIRCYRESASLASVFNLWFSLTMIDATLPGTDLARVELLSNAAMLAILGAGLYSTALLNRKLSFQTLRSHDNPVKTLKRLQIFARALIGVGILQIALGVWIIAQVQHLGVNVPLAIRDWARGFDVGKSYEPGQILECVAMSSVFARVVTAVFFFSVAGYILGKISAIRRELDRLAC